MNKKVVLTWENTASQKIVEECTLIDEAELQLRGKTSIKSMVESMVNSGMVVFEDDNGIFGLPAHQVKSIEVVQDA